VCAPNPAWCRANRPPVGRVSGHVCAGHVAQRRRRSGLCARALWWRSRLCARDSSRTGLIDRSMRDRGPTSPWATVCDGRHEHDGIPSTGATDVHDADGVGGVSREVGELDASVAEPAGLSRVAGRGCEFDAQVVVMSGVAGGNCQFDAQVVKMSRPAGTWRWWILASRSASDLGCSRCQCQHERNGSLRLAPAKNGGWPVGAVGMVRLG